MPLASSDTDTNNITWPKNSFYTSPWSSGHNECNDTDARANGVTWPKGHVSPYFDHSGLRSTMVPFTMHLHHMMLMPVSMASCDQESHVAFYFYHLDLKDVIVPYMMLLASCDTDTDANGIMWYQHQSPDVIQMVIPIVCQDQKVMLLLILIVLIKGSLNKRNWVMSLSMLMT